MSHLWAFRALDTFFFRDGISFHQGEDVVQPKSQFPPSMYTLQGAIRSRLAETQGWSPHQPEKWPSELGNANDLGQLRLQGPFLRIDQSWLYPIPYHLIGRKSEEKGWQLTRLRPGSLVTCDLGEVRLLEREKNIEGKGIEGWITREGMNLVLQGKEPLKDHIKLSDELWTEESKIGVGITRSTKKSGVDEKKLYFASHIRPKSRLEIVVHVDGIPPSWHPPSPFALPLGGEGRLAEVEIESAEATTHLEKGNYLPDSPVLEIDPDGMIRFTVTLLTHGSFADLSHVAQYGLPEIPGQCVSATLGKSRWMVGWDLEKKQPRPLIPLIPAGSTWFYEAPKEQKAQIEALHGKLVGERTAYGLGQIVIGRWKEKVNM